MITCQACGTQNPPDATFCTTCARKLDPDTQQAVRAEREAHTATGVRWSAVMAALILALVIILVVALFVTHIL